MAMSWQQIHFVGIAGAGLSALARVMLGRGVRVSGSDPAAPNQVTNDLEKLGATIFLNHDAQNIQGADLVVTTSAAQADNPEIVAALAQATPVLKRREFLREVTREWDVIAVAGSHGKTTTTAMLARILEDAGFDPTVVVGGMVPRWNTNARVGQSKWFVIEADEYDYAFLGLTPKILIVTNVDYDHPDLFPTRELYQQAFCDLMKQTRADGVCIVCGDEAVASKLAQSARSKVVQYGIEKENEWRAQQVRTNELGGSDFEIYRGTELMGAGTLRIPGQHNVLNALAAIVASAQTGILLTEASLTLKNFGGVGRRFQILGTFNGATIVDDYAHHPTEIRATLNAARMRFPNARIVALFQPHTFSRTRALLAEFANAFQDADRVVITEIYAAREKEDLGLSSRILVEQLNDTARYAATLAQAEAMLRMELRAGDVLLTLGAGDVNKVAGALIGSRNA